jgi:hypothetical protein
MMNSGFAVSMGDTIWSLEVDMAVTELTEVCVWEWKSIVRKGESKVKDILSDEVPRMYKKPSSADKVLCSYLN